MPDVIDPWPPAGTRWACVVVYEYPSPSKPIIVNVVGFDTKNQAQAHQRKIRKQVVTDRLSGKVIAIRVRPILEKEHFG